MVIFCTLPGDSYTMDNTEGISLPLDHMLEQYLSSYFFILSEVRDDQHDHTHQLGEIFWFFTEEYEMYFIIYRKN